MKAIVTGANGLLGRELLGLLGTGRGYDHQTLDVTDEAQVWSALTSRSADVVFHCAAMTNVDQCELNPAAARLTNAVASRTVAATCAALGIYLVAISTDYVFDGRQGQPLREDSETKPLSVYGRSKLEGEIAVQAVHPGAAIVRTSWLYGDGRPTFIDSVLDRVSRGEQVSIGRDQVSSPTWVADLAPALVRLAGLRCAGIFHLTGDGPASRVEWAQLAVRAAGLDDALVEAVDHVPAAARRPHYSSLTNVRARAVGISMPLWANSVEAYVRSRAAMEAMEPVA